MELGGIGVDIQWVSLLWSWNVSLLNISCSIFFVVITGITAFNVARFCHTFSILIVDHGEIVVLDMASILN